MFLVIALPSEVKRSLTKLPIPLDKSKEKSVTVRALVGYPRNSMNFWIVDTSTNM